VEGVERFLWFFPTLSRRRSDRSSSAARLSRRCTKVRLRGGRSRAPSAARGRREPAPGRLPALGAASCPLTRRVQHAHAPVRAVILLGRARERRCSAARGAEGALLAPCASLAPHAGGPPALPLTLPAAPAALTARRDGARAPRRPQHAALGAGRAGGGSRPGSSAGRGLVPCARVGQLLRGGAADVQPRHT
jgi:hypothetical protein